MQNDGQRRECMIRKTLLRFILAYQSAIDEAKIAAKSVRELERL